MSALQWNISDNLGIPGSSMYCQTTQADTIIGSDAVVLSLNAGTTYWISFDGNFGSDCTWDFSIERGGVLGGGSEIVSNTGYISIYPNPFSASATLVINSSLEKGARGLSFVMYDLLGRKTKQIEIVGNNVEINRDNLPSGMYFYKLSDKEKTLATGKVVIQ